MHFHSFGRIAAVLLGGSTLFWSPTHLAAQACVGSPTESSQTAIDRGVRLTRSATGFGAGITTTLDAPVSLSFDLATYDLDILDGNQHRFEARVAIELPVERLSLCPTTGAGYTTFNYRWDGRGMTFSELYFPMGLGIGKDFEVASGLSLIPSAVVNLFVVRDKISVTDGSDTGSVSGSSTGVGVTVGTTLRFQRLYWRGAVSFGENSILGLSLGFVF